MGNADFTLRDHTGITNPVIDENHPTDIGAVTYVADPFIVKQDDTYYLFYEAKIAAGTVICYSASSDGVAWTYGAKVLDSTATLATANLSYPYVFKAGDTWYMVPNLANGNVNLYKATTFPTTWAFVETLTSQAYQVADTTVFQWQGYYYMITGDFTNTNLRLFYSEKLFARPWIEHPSSPMYAGSLRNCRPAGRPIIRADSIDIFLQDSVISYGNKVRGYRITALSPTVYTATEMAQSPLMEGDGSGWNAAGMHQLDRVDNTLSVVDASSGGNYWAIGLYEDVAP